MWYLLKLIFAGHIHKWKTIEKRELAVSHYGEPIARGYRYVQQCEKCGIIVKRDLI